MPTNYLGNATATQAPSNAPGPGAAPTVVIPNAGEAATRASIAQALQTLADYQAWSTSGQFEDTRESFDWSDSASYTADQLPVPNYAKASLKIASATAPIAMVGPGQGTPPLMTRGLSITAGAVATDYSFYSTTAARLGFGTSGSLANYSLCLDVPILFPTTLPLTGQNYYVGFANPRFWNFAAGLDPTFVGLAFNASGGSGTWSRCLSGGVSAIAGVTPTAGAYQMWRIEWFGASTVQGVANGAAFTRYSLNRSIVATFNGTPTIAHGNLYLVLGGNCGIASAAPAMIAGAYRLQISVTT